MSTLRTKGTLKKYLTKALLPLASLLLFTGLTSCNSTKSGPEIQHAAKFETKELSNGIKLFTYQARLERERIRPIRTGDRTQEASRQNDKDQDHYKAEKRFEKAMLNDPRVIRYCPKGVLIIEQHFVNQVLTIRGECK